MRRRSRSGAYEGGGGASPVAADRPRRCVRSGPLLAHPRNVQVRTGPAPTVTSPGIDVGRALQDSHRGRRMAQCSVVPLPMHVAAVLECHALRRPLKLRRNLMNRLGCRALPPERPHPSLLLPARSAAARPRLQPPETDFARLQALRAQPSRCLRAGSAIPLFDPCAGFQYAKTGSATAGMNGTLYALRR